MEPASRIARCLAECRTLLSSSGCTSVKQAVEEACSRLEQPMQLAVIGKISSSKSTLVNAILGQAEVVRTGQMEETFNVSWLKYGSSRSPIRVVFKDGTSREVARSDWSRWTSHQEENTLKEQVKYIEVAYEHEILKKINIIDTPGLDAHSTIDSLNTIAFLKEVRPDAVVMLFTHGSIAQNILSILNDFQHFGQTDLSYTFSPLNAIGVLAKADLIWSASRAENQPLEDGERVVASLYANPAVKKSLYAIIPLSAQLSLLSATISEADLGALRPLAAQEEGLWLEMLSSPDFFADEEYRVGVSPDVRAALSQKIGLYGLYVLLLALKADPGLSKEAAAGLLKRSSGFDKFLFLLHTHFGERAQLIKVQNAMQRLLAVCKRTRTESREAREMKKIETVQTKINTLLLSLHAYREIALLADIYEERVALPADQKEEFLAVCGERGPSVTDKLGLPAATPVEAMQERIKNRALYWRKQYNLCSWLDPVRADAIKVLMQAYNALYAEVEEAAGERAAALETLRRTALFFYGQEKEVSL